MTTDSALLLLLAELRARIAELEGENAALLEQIRPSATPV